MVEYPIYKLKEVSLIIAGQSPESKYYNSVGDGLPFFQGKADFGDLYPTIRTYCSKPTKIAEKDDILLSVRAPVGPTNLSPGKVCIGRGLSAIRPGEKLDLRYLLYYFRQYEAYLREKGTGTTFKAITQDILKNLEIPVPPLEEQKRIVARIEELFSELDAAVATLEQTKEQLAVYRQAVLKEAFESLSHDTPYPFIRDVCHEVKVGIVIKPKQYYTDKPNGIRAFRSANVREFYVNDSDWVYLTEYGHEQNKRSEIHTGDVLVVRSGYPGTACVVPEEFNNCNAIDILIAVPNKDKITSEYLCAYTNSPHGRKLITEKKRGVAQAHLNVGGYSQMTIPVPDIETQKQIVDGIELKLSIYDNIMKTLDDSLREAEAMRQSILKRAFAGEL